MRKGMKQWKQCTLEVVGEIIFYSRTEGQMSKKCMAGRVMWLHKARKLDSFIPYKRTSFALHLMPCGRVIIFIPSRLLLILQ
jgi:hypothetical protein